MRRAFDAHCRLAAVCYLLIAVSNQPVISRQRSNLLDSMRWSTKVLPITLCTPDSFADQESGTHMLLGALKLLATAEQPFHAAGQMPEVGVTVSNALARQTPPREKSSSGAPALPCTPRT